MMNICAGFVLPSLPDIPFDLVLCTQSFQSILLSEANTSEAKDNLPLEAVAEELFSKDGVNIRKAFDHVLSLLFGINPE